MHLLHAVGSTVMFPCHSVTLLVPSVSQVRVWPHACAAARGLARHAVRVHRLQPHGALERSERQHLHLFLVYNC